jgi:hypothetical protein
MFDPDRQLSVRIADRVLDPTIDPTEPRQVAEVRDRDGVVLGWLPMAGATYTLDVQAIGVLELRLEISSAEVHTVGARSRRIDSSDAT